MAKKSKIARNEQRKVIVARYNEKRIALKKTLIDENATPEEREAARVALQKLPRNRFPRSPCVTATRSTAAPAVTFQKFGISRVALPRDGTPRRAARYHQVQLVNLVF